MRAQIDTLRTLLDDSQKSIGLDEKHFRAAISAALQLLNADKLKPLNGSSEDSPKMKFPALDQREGAASDWADTMDTLRTPKPRDQKLWEWRRTSPIRPVVFKDPGTLDDTVVHLHLEHRVVQRLLGRFTAQGFSLHELSRACLAQSDDAISICRHEVINSVQLGWFKGDIDGGEQVPFDRAFSTHSATR